ncbi:MAG: YceI family protein [Bacteroidales bacterium]|nr:YceI family protein [Bacteroidales bacterium]
MTAKTTWVIDPSHSEIAFKVKHLMISNVKGSFGEFSGQLVTDGDDFSTAEIGFQINPASISTGSADRDGHLKSPDFFDVDNFKEITFTSGRLALKGGDDYTLTGDLAIKGVSQTVKLDVEFGGLMTDPWGNVKAGFTINGKISRTDFGLTWNAALEAGGVLVGDEIRLNLDVQLLQQKA